MASLDIHLDNTNFLLGVQNRDMHTWFIQNAKTGICIVIETHFCLTLLSDKKEQE